MADRPGLTGPATGPATGAETGGPATIRAGGWMLPVAVMAAGAAAYAVIAAGALIPGGSEPFGRLIYNYYFLSLIEGRFDVPLRVVTLEGHYTPDGTAYVYQGVAPVLTRLLAWPFVDLETVPVAGWSIWLFTCLGNVALQVAGTQLVLRAPQLPAPAWMLSLGIGLMVWLCGPGLVLIANHSYYHEPLSIAYFCAAGSVLLYTGVVFLGAELRRALLPLALLAGLAVLARPHVAVGLYAGVAALMALHLWRVRRPAAIGPLLVPGAVLLGFGLTFLAVNALRFGDPLTMFGANEAAAVEYGFTYWGVHSADTARIAAFLEHGTFNLGRVLPNAMLYLVDLPWGYLTGEPRNIEAGPLNALYRAWTADLGLIRVEEPRIGLVWIWAPWLVLAAFAWRARPRDRAAGWAFLAATAAIALFILSYGTVTLRYRVEVFPFLAALAMFGLAGLLRGPAPADGTGRRGRRGLGVVMAGAIAAASLASLGNAVLYADNLRESRLFAAWDRETCEEMALEKGFAAGDLDRLCSL